MAGSHSVQQCQDIAFSCTSISIAQGRIISQRRQDAQDRNSQGNRKDALYLYKQHFSRTKCARTETLIQFNWHLPFAIDGARLAGQHPFTSIVTSERRHAALGFFSISAGLSTTCFDAPIFKMRTDRKRLTIQHSCRANVTFLNTTHFRLVVCVAAIS